jgi:hypothetical protein
MLFHTSIDLVTSGSGKHQSLRNLKYSEVLLNYIINLAQALLMHMYNVHVYCYRIDILVRGFVCSAIKSVMIEPAFLP